LINIGKDLLERKVARVNVDTGAFETVEGGPTNEQALKDMAKLLSKERNLRQAAARQ
jgi:hypothetical protein